MQAVEPFWVVAKTKAQRERWAAENIVRQGFEYYMPLTAPPKKPTTRNKPLKPQCLFPRYLFVQTDGRWRFLLGTFGVTGLVMQGDRPAIMPTVEILNMKAREGENGLIVLPKQTEHRFASGDKVRINSGVFSGYSGIYELDPNERVRVLLDLLGRKTRVAIDEDCLEAVG